MRKLIKPIFWTFLFLAMMLAIDQFFVQVPPMHPSHGAVADFYLDFRGRLIDLSFGEKKKSPKSIEAVIDKQQKNKEGAQPQNKANVKKTPPPEPKTSTPKTQRYVYSDGKGELHFAESLEEVPEEYRAQAQPMSR